MSEIKPERYPEYRYREGVHGEHCIDYGAMAYQRLDTIGRVASKDDALRLVNELNLHLTNHK